MTVFSVASSTFPKKLAQGPTPPAAPSCLCFVMDALDAEAEGRSVRESYDILTSIVLRTLLGVRFRGRGG